MGTCTRPCTPNSDRIRPSTLYQCTHSAHEIASIKQLPSGSWRALVRRKQYYASETFWRHEDAKRWTLAFERSIDLDESPIRRSKVDPTTLGHLIDLCATDMKEAWRASRRSKAFTLDALKDKLSRLKIKDLNRERLIKFVYCSMPCAESGCRVRNWHRQPAPAFG